MLQNRANFVRGVKLKMRRKNCEKRGSEGETMRVHEERERERETERERERLILSGMLRCVSPLKIFSS